MGWGFRVSSWCFFSAKCGSRISTRFLIYRTHAVCFFPLVTPWILSIYFQCSPRPQVTTCLLHAELCPSHLTVTPCTLHRRPPTLVFKQENHTIVQLLWSDTEWSISNIWGKLLFNGSNILKLSFLWEGLWGLKLYYCTLSFELCFFICLFLG
jgi:hypothetical protein